MSKVLWLIAGVLIGGVAAFAAAGTASGRELSQTVADSYRARRNELVGG